MNSLDILMEKRAAKKAEADGIVGKLDVEKRSINADEKAKFDGIVSDLKQLDNEIDCEVRSIETANRVNEVRAKFSTALSKPSCGAFEEIGAAMKEKRAITINGTGAINVVSTIVREMVKNTDIASKYRYFYGPNASTTVPILSPSIARPAAQLESATGISADSTAVLSAKTLQPKAYFSELGVSMESLSMSATSIESELPSIFADAFLDAMVAGSIVSDGTMTGMFADAAGTTDSTCALTGTPTLKDLLAFAIALRGYKQSDAMIVMNGALLAPMLSETGDYEGVKNEIMSRMTVLGIPLMLSPYAPTAITAGNIVMVGIQGSNYGVAIANELSIEPIRVRGDTNTYFQATMFMNGTTIIPKNVLQMKTI